MYSKYTRLDLHKITDEEGTATDKKQSWKKFKDSIKNYTKKRAKQLFLTKCLPLVQIANCRASRFQIPFEIQTICPELSTQVFKHLISTSSLENLV